MKNRAQIQKLTLAAVLTSLSIVIDVVFKTLAASTLFGFPFYAIPIILGSILLGPIYGAIMAFLGDALGVMISGQGYLPLFVLAPLVWGILPGIIMHKKYKVSKLSWTVPLTYLFASSFNTLAIFVYFGSVAAMTTFALRVTLILFNSVVIVIVVRDLHERLMPLHEHFSMHSKASNEQ
ncbi:MAG: folate family ECF transporter S component [Acholeplasmataceae bacterium]|nr:folate family ECF transporter S component [Acholeplasmataceae bacterium]